MISSTEMSTNAKILSFLLIAAFIVINVVQGKDDGKNQLSSDFMILVSLSCTVLKIEYKTISRM